MGVPGVSITVTLHVHFLYWHLPYERYLQYQITVQCLLKDTEAAVGDLQVPQVDPEVICGDVRLEVGVDRDGVDVVGVGVGEYSAWRGLHH